MNIEILETRIENTPTMKIEGFLIHSKYNPLKEAQQFAKANYKPGALHFVYGYGMGYYIEALLKEFQHDEVLVVVDPFQLLKDDSRYIAIGKDSMDNIKAIIDAAIAKAPHIQYIETPNYNNFEIEVNRNVRMMVKSRTSINQLLFNTYNSFADIWYENKIRNLYHMQTDYNLKELYNRFTVPVVVASGGPSLTKQLEFVKYYRDKIILIASGSTINSLLMADIEPDYIVNIDGGKINNIKHYEKLKGSKIPYIYAINSTYEVRNFFKGDAYYFTQEGFSTSKELNSELFADIEKLNAGVTVATFALTIATKISSGPVALIGQDLAYTNLQSHASNNENFSVIQDVSSLLEVEGYYGDKVYTDAPLDAMRYNFEIIKEYILGDIEIYNCTEGGAKINGYNQISFEEFCRNFTKEKVIKFSPKTLNKQNKFKDAYIQYLQEELENAKKLLNITEDSLEILDTIGINKKFDETNSKKLEKNNKKMYKYIEQSNATIMFEMIALNAESIYLPTLNETKNQTFTRAYGQQSYIYLSVKEAASRIIAIIENFLKGIWEDENGSKQ